jgi:hypothetical protein
MLAYLTMGHCTRPGHVDKTARDAAEQVLRRAQDLQVFRRAQDLQMLRRAQI